MTKTTTITLVLGGASSGKSKFAEELAIKSKLNKIYLASANIYDEEMKRKVEIHKNRRGKDWVTITEPIDVNKKIKDLKKGEIMLFDCATMWLTNQMLDDASINNKILELINAIKLAQGSIIIVSNEVGSGIVPDNSMARQFRDYQGQLNQDLASASDTVITVTAGLPLFLKQPS